MIRFVMGSVWADAAVGSVVAVAGGYGVSIHLHLLTELKPQDDGRRVFDAAIVAIEVQP